MTKEKEKEKNSPLIDRSQRVFRGLRHFFGTKIISALQGRIPLVGVAKELGDVIVGFDQIEQRNLTKKERFLRGVFSLGMIITYASILDGFHIRETTFFDEYEKVGSISYLGANTAYAIDKKDAVLLGLHKSRERIQKNKQQLQQELGKTLTENNFILTQSGRDQLQSQFM